MNKSIWLLAGLLIAIIFVSGCTQSTTEELPEENEKISEQTQGTVKQTPSEPEAEQAKPQLEVIQLDCYNTGFDDISDYQGKVIAQVKNNGTVTAEFVKIYVNFYNKEGKLVGAESIYTQPSTIPANRTGSVDYSAIIGLPEPFETCDATVDYSNY